MNLADVSNAATMATRLAQVKQIMKEVPTQATFSITTSAGSYTVTLTETEWTLGLQQIENELTQGLTGLGVNVS